MRTTFCRERYFAQTLGAFFRRRVGGWAFAGAADKHVHRLHDKKENGRGHEYERDDGIYEMTVFDFRTVERKDESAEIRNAGDRGDKGSDEVKDKRIDDSAERRTNDDADRKVDYVTAQKEFLELL